jgi:hypothetical protein
MSQFTIDTKVMQKIARNTPERIGQFLDAMSEEMVTDIKLSFPTDGPSAPGQPPAIDTSTLLQSIDWERSGKFSRAIHDGVLYGVVHEMGDSTHELRPFMTPIFEKWRDQFESFAQDFGLIEP